jgi:hypothetical protein
MSTLSCQSRTSSISEVDDHAEDKELLSANNPKNFLDRVNQTQYYSDCPTEQHKKVKLESNPQRTNIHKTSFSDHLITQGLTQKTHMSLQNASLGIRNETQNINNLNKEQEMNMVHNKGMFIQNDMGPSLFDYNLQNPTNTENGFDASSVSTRSSLFTPKKNRKDGVDSGNNSNIKKKKGGVQAKLLGKGIQSQTNISTRFKNNDKGSFGGHQGQSSFGGQQTHKLQQKQQAIKTLTQKNVVYDEPPSSITPHTLNNGFPIRLIFFLCQ